MKMKMNMALSKIHVLIRNGDNCPKAGFETTEKQIEFKTPEFKCHCFQLEK
jgi:hypothetical protein